MVADPITAFSGPEAEIDIFKPDRAKAFVEAPQAGPSLAPDEQEGASGLLGIAWAFGLSSVLGSTGTRVAGSTTTFSITEPKRMASQINGSRSFVSLMHLA